MKRLNVGQITLSMGQGGIEQLILSLARIADGKEVAYRVYCLDTGGVLLNELKELDVPTSIFNRRPGHDWRLVVRLARVFKEDRLDVVHTHNQAAHFYGALAAKLAGIPVIINTEHSRFQIQHHWRRRLEKRLLSYITDTLVAVSEELRQHTVEVDKIAAHKLKVIMNGIDVQRFDSVTAEMVNAFKQDSGIPVTANVISIIARLHPIKNHSLLFHAIHKTVKSSTDLRLVVVGDGPEKEKLVNLAETLELSDKILFLGNRTDVPVILKASDVTVLCSIAEGLPLVLLEAMAARTPIVVTKGANLSGIIQQAVNGFLAGETPDAFSDDLVALLANKNSLEAITDQAYNLVTSNYTIESTAKAYLSSYRQEDAVQ